MIKRKKKEESVRNEKKKKWYKKEKKKKERNETKWKQKKRKKEKKKERMKVIKQEKNQEMCIFFSISVFIEILIYLFIYKNVSSYYLSLSSLVCGTQWESISLIMVCQHELPAITLREAPMHKRM